MVHAAIAAMITLAAFLIGRLVKIWVLSTDMRTVYFLK
jgi:hypothetical protein